MKKTNKLLSLILAVSILLTSAISISGAAYVAPEIPQTGMVFYDDFNYGVSTQADITNLMKETWYNSYNLYPDKSDEEHGDVIYGTPNAAATGMVYNNKKAGYGVEHIDSGKLRITTSYMLPSGYPMPSLKESVYLYYFTTYAKNGELDVDDDDYATGRRNYHYSFEIGTNKTDNPRICFAQSPRDGAAPSSANDSGITYMDVEYDKWYVVDIVIDYDNATANYYVNGELACEVNVDRSRLKTHYPVYSASIDKSGNKGTDEYQRLYIDNFGIERLGEDFSAKISGYGDDYVDVSFDYAVSEKDLNLLKATLKNPVDEKEIKSVSTVKVSADKARIKFAEKLRKGCGYEIVLDNDVYPVWGGDNKISAGTSFFFTTGIETENIELLDIDFENNFDLSSAVNKGDIQLFDSDDGRVYTLNDEENTLKHISLKKSDDENSYLELKHNSASHPYDNVQFNFLNGASVENGILITEFDYARAYDETVTDTNGDTYTGYNAMAMASRGYLGYVDSKITSFVKDGENVGIVIGSDEATSRNSSYITKFIHGAGNWNAGSWGWGLSSADKYKICSGQPEDWIYIKTLTNCNGKFYKIKIETDLDNDTHKVYVDGVLCGDYKYMPGDVTENAFTAFVMSASRYSKLIEEGSYFRIDNIKASNLISKPYVKEITTEDYNGNIKEFSSNISAGTKKIIIEFSSALADGAQNFVTYTGNDVSAIIADGKTLTIEFANCLKAGQEYKIVFGEAMGLDSDFAVKFKADAGEAVYNTPVFKVNNIPSSLNDVNVGDVIEVASDVINTTADTVGCIITVAVYKDGYMTGFYGNELTIAPDDLYVQKARVRFVADEKFAEADEIKIFIVNNGTTANPVIVPVVVN